MNGHRSSSNNPDNFTPYGRNPHQISPTPFWFLLECTCIHNLSPPILITSPATVFNLPINSFCPLDIALVLTSDDIHWIFPPSPPLLLSCGSFSSGSYSKISSGAIFTPRSQILSRLIDKDLSESQNSSVKFPRALSAFHLETSFFRQDFSFLFLFFYTTLLEMYPTFVYRKPNGFQWSFACMHDFFSHLSIAPVDGKQHLSEVVFSARLTFIVYHEYAQLSQTMIKEPPKKTVRSNTFF